MTTKVSFYPHFKTCIKLYDRYVLSKLSWHFIVADTSKIWICENLDNIVTKYVREWLDLPISATISSIIFSKKNFGLAFQLPSFKCQQCQTVLRSSLKQSFISFRFVVLSLVLCRNSQLHTACYKRGVFLYLKYLVGEWFKKSYYYHCYCCYCLLNHSRSCLQNFPYPVRLVLQRKRSEKFRIASQL